MDKSQKPCAPSIGFVALNDDVDMGKEQDVRSQNARGQEGGSPRGVCPQTRLQSGPPDHAQVAFHPPLLLALALIIGFIMRWLAPLPFLPPGLSASLGPMLTAASFGLFFWAVYTMRAGNASIPTSEPTDAIVVRGPFRFSRNPIYLSMLLLQVGVGIWANSLWFFILAAISSVLLWWGVISREEQYLQGKFGSEYSSYMSRVRRWL